MHLNTETAFDLMEGRLGKAAEADWEDHIASCNACLALRQECSDLRTALKRRHLESAPQSMLDSAVSLFQPTPVVERRAGIRQLVASLAFDSLLQPAFEGARGATTARQVVLRAEEFDIHVRIWMTEESRELLGQIQPRGNKAFTQSARLHLLHDGERVSSVDVNDLGEFHFRFVPDGLLSLQIDLPHLTVIGALDVSEKSKD